jgi:hypothetical protein
MRLTAEQRIVKKLSYVNYANRDALELESDLVARYDVNY